MAYGNAVNATQDGVQSINSGVWTGSALTQYEVLLGDSANAISSVGSLGGSAQVLTSQGLGMNPTWADVPIQSFPYTDESIPFNAAISNGYFIKAGSVVATLPASPSQGDQIEFIVDTSNTFQIQANTGQTIQLSSLVSSSAGTLTSSGSTGDTVVLVYSNSDTNWIAKSTIGNWIPA